MASTTSGPTDNGLVLRYELDRGSEPEPPFLKRVARNSSALATAGVVNVIAAATAGAGWIGLHTTYWEGQFTCSAQLSWAPRDRWALMALTAFAAVSALVTMYWIGRQGAESSHTLVRSFWFFSAVLWIATIVAVASVGVLVEDCLRGPVL